MARMDEPGVEFTELFKRVRSRSTLFQRLLTGKIGYWCIKIFKRITMNSLRKPVLREITLKNGSVMNRTPAAACIDIFTSSQPCSAPPLGVPLSSSERHQLCVNMIQRDSQPGSEWVTEWVSLPSECIKVRSTGVRKWSTSQRLNTCENAQLFILSTQSRDCEYFLLLAVHISVTDWTKPKSTAVASERVKTMQEWKLKE